MKWTEIRIKTTEEAYDAVSEMLMSIGAGGVAIDDPLDIRRQIESPGSLDYADREFIDSLGDDVVVRAYFRADTDDVRTGLEQLIREKLVFISRFLDVGDGYYGFSEVDEEDWANAWKKFFKPFNISGHIAVKPSWEEYEAKPGETVVELDPGMAFGTGTHETTGMCSQLMEKYVIQGNRVMDVGCGTGILSIIAAKLGASHVEALDIDAGAVAIARENCRINGVQDRVCVSQGVLESFGSGGEDIVPADIIAANIIADVIIGMSEIIWKCLKKGGLFITSGIIRERRDEVLETYIQKGYACMEILEKGEWVAMVFRA